MEPQPESQSRSNPLFGSGDRRNLSKLSTMSISELISELRDTFMRSDFNRVEETLVSREAMLKAEIEEKNLVIGLLQERIQFERLEKIRVELELKKVMGERGEKVLESEFGVGRSKVEVLKNRGVDIGAVLKVEGEKVGILGEKKRLNGESSKEGCLGSSGLKLLVFEVSQSHRSAHRHRTTYRTGLQSHNDMDPGGGFDPPRRSNKGKKTMTDEPPKRRRNREVVINIGNMRGHTFFGPPATAPIAPQPPPAPSGPGWYHLPSHGHYMGPPNAYAAGHMGTPAAYMGTPAGHMGTPAGHIGSSSGHMGPTVGLFMPTAPEPQDDIEHDIGGGNVDFDSSTDDERVEVVVINGVRLKVIYSRGNALLPAKAASSSITHVIRKKYFQKFHKKWSKVDDNDRNDLLDFFRTKVTWDIEDNDNVQRLFFKRMGAQISDLLYKLRCKDKKPNYMSDEIWNAFKGHWATETFKKNAAKAKNNRNSEKGGSLHCGGSINQAQHASRLSKKAGRPITAPELHRATHVRKGTGEYVDERSRMTQEQINEIMTQLTQGGWDPESLGQLTPEMIDLANQNWEKTVGWSKGRLYGTGPLAPCMGQSVAGSSRRCSRPASTPAQTEHIRQLEQELQSTRHELHDTRQEVRTSTEAMKKMQEDFVNVSRRQELMFRYFKNMQQHEQQDEEQAEESGESGESEEAGETEESDGGSF